MNKFRSYLLLAIITALLLLTACRVSYKDFSGAEPETESSESSMSSEETSVISETAESDFVSEDIFEEMVSLPFIPFD